MNTMSVRSAASKVMAAAFSVVLLVGTAFESKANENEKKEKSVAASVESRVSVEYKNSNDNVLLFNVQFENPAAEKFSLIVKDDEGAVIYEQQFSDAHFNKTIHLVNESNDIHPTFIIRSGKQQVARSFAVTSNTRTVENVEVTKL